MSIITRRGDDGFTDVMYGGRVPKTAPGVVACGAVDELTSSLGMVRVSAISEEMAGQIDSIQGHLITLMGLLSVPSERRDQYLADGYPSIGQEEIAWLDEIGENVDVKIEGWARPGAAGHIGSAWMDMARSICRRAELAAWVLGDDVPVEVCKYLNRLSDILWLWARKLEEAGGVTGRPKNP